MNPKFLFFIALYVSAILPASARQQSVGFQAGFGWTEIHLDLFDGRDSRPRLNLGLNYERFLSNNLSLSADLLFQQRGNGAFLVLYDINAQPAGTAYFDFRFNYAALPIKVGYSVGKKGFGFGKLGIVPAVLLNASIITPGNYLTGPRTAHDITGECARFDLGGIAEAGGGFHFDRSFQLFGSLAYQHSITRFWNRGYPGISDRHHGWSLNIGLRYDLPARTAGASAPPAER